MTIKPSDEEQESLRDVVRRHMGNADSASNTAQDSASDASGNFVVPPIRIRLPRPTDSDLFAALRNRSPVSFARRYRSSQISPPIQGGASCSSAQPSGNRDLVSPPIQDGASCSSAQSSQPTEEVSLVSLLMVPVSPLVSPQPPVNRDLNSPPRRYIPYSSAGSNINIPPHEDNSDDYVDSDETLDVDMGAGPADENYSQDEEMEAFPAGENNDAQDEVMGAAPPSVDENNDAPDEEMEAAPPSVDSGGRSLFSVNVDNPTPGFRFARGLIMDFARMNNLRWRPPGFERVRIVEEEYYNRNIVRALRTMDRIYQIPPELRTMRDDLAVGHRGFRKFALELADTFFKISHDAENFMGYLDWITQFLLYTYKSNEENFMLEGIAVIADIIDFYSRVDWFIDQGGLRYYFNAAMYL